MTTAQERSIRERAHKILGPGCRDHLPPYRIELGGYGGWRCIDCGKVVSDRDVTGTEYPPTQRQLRDIARDELLRRDESDSRTERAKSCVGYEAITKDELEGVARRYKRIIDMADALGVHPSSISRAAKKLGVNLK